MSTALQRALSGAPLSGSQARSLATTIERGRRAMRNAREMGGKYGEIVLHEAEASGAAFVAGTAAGRFGEKVKIWGWNGIGLAGLAGLFVGAYGRANRRGWGGHVYSIAQGAAHATIADAGRRWGEEMKAKAAGADTTTPAAPPADGKPAAASTSAPSDVKPSGIGVADLDRYLREVTLANTGLQPARAV